MNQPVEQKVNQVNRNYKDSVFVDLFGKCKDAEANFLSLYNAITDKNLKLEETKIEPLMLEQTIYTGRYNDVSMIINDSLVVMVEQQSTVNENMPLRFLEYITKIYEKLVPSKNRYFKKMIPLPNPEFYVIYNGTDDYPVEKTLRLSDAFKNSDSQKDKGKNNEKISLELFVKVFNINKGRNTKLLMKCIPLSGYARLVELVLEQKSCNNPNAVDDAVKQCIEEGILVDYFKYNSTEVRNMLIGEYNYEDDIAAQRQEEREQTSLDTAIRMIKDKKLSMEDISKYSDVPLEKVTSLAEELKS